MRATVVTDVVNQHWTARRHFDARLVLAVKHSKRVLAIGLLVFVTQFVLVRSEVVAQQGDVGTATFVVTHGIDEQRDSFQANRQIEIPRQRNDFDVDGRIIRAQHFDGELVVLTIATGLGTFDISVMNAEMRL